MKSNELYGNTIGDNPLGSCSDLNPILIRWRNISSIIEIIFAFVIPLISLLSYFVPNNKFPNTPSPPINKVDINSIADWFLLFGKDSKVVCLPNKPMMHYLIGNTSFLKTAINGGIETVNGTIKIFPGTDLTYVNKYENLKEIIRSTAKNNIGFEWENIDSPNALTKPSIKVYIQSVFGTPQPSIYFQIRDSLVRIRSLTEGDLINIEQMKYMNIDFYESEFAHPQIIQRMTQLSFAVALLSPISIILETLPDMELIFYEKDVHITALSFLMGMSEIAYWFTNFIVSFIICFVIYLYISLVYAFWYGLNGNDFGMIFILSLLFVIAEIWFQFFMTTIINNAAKGKSLTIVLIMTTILLSFFFQFVTLKEKSTASIVLNNICSIFPISAYQIFLMQGYIANVADLPPYRWNDMNNKAYICPPWIPFMWCSIDIVLYFTLFVICNVVVPRSFGITALNLSNLFKYKKKLRINGDNSSYNSNSNSSNESIIEVNNLLKVYHGSRKINALNSISFEIKKGEVIVIIGPNGAGKSTLINCISGGLKPTDGNITVLGKSTINNLGVCYQENVIIPQLSVQEHFELFGAFRGISEETLQSSINYLSKNMQLEHILKNRAGDLSGGQKRKLCIGLTLLGNPEIVLMDEPTAGVDVQACQLIWKMISNLKDTTSIITSHALEEAEVVSSRLFILSEGVIRFIGTSTELREQFKCGYELRVETNNDTIQNVLDLVKKYVSDAKIAEDRQDVILIPVNLSISKLLYAIRNKQNELGIISYSFAVQQLEDMLLKSLDSMHQNTRILDSDLESFY